MAKNEEVKTLDQNDFRKGLPRFQGEHLDNNWKLAEAFGEYAKKKGCTPAQLAIAWVLNKGDFIIPIPGTKHVKYLKDNIGAVDVIISKDDYQALDQLLKDYPYIGERYGNNENKFIKK